MNLMDIVIHPSILPEPFGIVNLEAMSLGKPVISMKIGAPLEIYENGVSGILVEPENPRELAGAIKKLLGDPDYARQIGSKGYDRLNEKFTLQKNIDQTSRSTIASFNNEDLADNTYAFIRCLSHIDHRVSGTGLPLPAHSQEDTAAVVRTRFF